jgi:hypothetical protein
MGAAPGIHPHLRVFACRHVYARERPGLLVSRADGPWCFLCGGQHAQSADDFMALCLEHILEADRSLSVVFDLEPGWEAERSDKNAPWVRSAYFPGKE